MVLSDSCGEILGVPESSARFLLALFSGYLVASAYKLLFAKQSALVQNVFFSVSGLGVLYYVYGEAVLHSLLDVVLVYLVMLACGGTLLCVTLTWSITLGHLLLGYAGVILSDQVHPVHWTIPQCVLLMKLVGLAFNLYDAKKKPEQLSQQMAQISVHVVPSPLEIMGFSYFFGTVLAGPQMTFDRYKKFVEGRLYDVHRTPSSIPAGLLRLLVAICFAALYSVLNQHYPISYLGTDEFTSEPLLHRLWLVFVSGKVALWRYVTVWLVAEGACIISGVTYNGEKEGRIDWHALTNVYVIAHELTITLQGVIYSFNVNTNQWVSWYCYKRLKWLGNRLLSLFITMTFVSFWHGLWPGYFLNFYMEPLFLYAEIYFISWSTDLFGCPLSELHLTLRVPLAMAAYVLKNLLILYPVTCFMLLSWKACWQFMSAVYFYGPVVVVLWLVVYLLLLKSASRKKTD